MAEPVVEKAHRRLVRALLRGEDVRRARRAEERGVDVAHGLHRHAREPRLHAVERDGGDAAQRPARRDEGDARLVAEHRPERRRHAAAAVVRRAAPEAEDNAPRARSDRAADQLADAVGCGAKRIPSLARERQTGRRRHLDDSRPVRQPPIERAHRLAERACDRLLHALPAEGGEKSVDGALAAVRDGEGNDLRLRLMPQNRAPHYPADLRRGHRALERIGNQDVFRHVPFLLPAPAVPRESTFSIRQNCVRRKRGRLFFRPGSKKGA